jgi:hypothetical protein
MGRNPKHGSRNRPEKAGRSCIVEMELLIIKSGEDYVRVKTENYNLCQLDKASVFPIDHLDQVKKHVKKLKEKDFPFIAIYKLKLIEEPLEPE